MAQTAITSEVRAEAGRKVRDGMEATLANIKRRGANAAQAMAAADAPCRLQVRQRWHILKRRRIIMQVYIEIFAYGNNLSHESFH